MAIVLPELPYSKKALSPHISEETLDYHYGKHHKGYVDKLNHLIVGTEWEKSDLANIVKNCTVGGIFNTSAQTWNHNFYWECLSPHGGSSPKGTLAGAIEKHYGSFEEFKKQFTAVALSHFGSGWAWFLKEGDKFKIYSTSDATTPLINEGQKVLMVCDVWEHAYYIDYRNARGKYLEAFWNLVNWEFVNKNLDS